MTFFDQFNEINPDDIKAVMTFMGIPGVLSKNLCHCFYLVMNMIIEMDIEGKLLNINNIDCAGSKIGSGSWKPIISDVVIGKCAKVSEYAGR